MPARVRIATSSGSPTSGWRPRPTRSTSSSPDCRSRSRASASEDDHGGDRPRSKRACAPTWVASGRSTRRRWRAPRPHLDRLTKPPGSLGRLEALVIQLAGITGRPDAPVAARAIVVAAGDHGVTAQGVSAYPAEVTAQMVANFVAGGAAINVLAEPGRRTGRRPRRRRRATDPAGRRRPGPRRRDW